MTRYIKKYTNKSRPYKKKRQTRKMFAGAVGAADVVGLPPINVKNTKSNSIQVNDDSITGKDTIGAKFISSTGNIADNIVNKSIKAADNILGPALDKTSDALFGNMTEMPFSEAAPKLTKEIKENAEFLRKAANDPEIRAALTEYGVAFGAAVKTASEIAKPVIDEAVKDGLEALDEAGEKAAIGVVNTGLNLFKAAVAEIPVVGAVVDLGLAGAQAINYTAAAASPLIVSGSKTLSSAMDAIENSKTEITDVSNKINSANSKLKGTVDSLKQKINPSTYNITGGGRKKAKYTAKRITNSLNRFTRRKH